MKKMRERTDGCNLVNQQVQKISKEDVRAAMKRMQSGKVVGADDIRGCMEMSR